MNTTELASLVIASLAVAGAIGSVLMLAYRVGRLTGATEARMSQGDTDRTNLWRALGELTERFNRHIDQHQITR